MTGWPGVSEKWVCLIIVYLSKACGVKLGHSLIILHIVCQYMTECKRTMFNLRLCTKTANMFLEKWSDIHGKIFTPCIIAMYEDHAETLSVLPSALGSSISVMQYTFHTDHCEALFLISQHLLEGHLKKKNTTKQKMEQNMEQVLPLY